MGARHVWLGVILGLAGCRQVLGLEEPTHGASDARVADGGNEVDGQLLFDAAPGCFGHSPDDFVCFSAQPTSVVDLGTGLIDTDTSSMCSTAVTAGPSGCVIAGAKINVVGAVTTSGSRPLILVATDSIVISSAGSIDVASHSGSAGAGAFTMCLGQVAATLAGGGAGGTFGGQGGDGGDDHNSVGKGVAAAPITQTKIRGGCSGGNGSTASGPGGVGGGAGGATLLIAATLQINGVINASGGGGRGGPNGNAARGAGGGGSGGLIAIDAVLLSGSGRLIANGGGGGGGGILGAAGGNGADPDPNAPSTPALGGTGCCGPETVGGSGGAGTLHNGRSPTGAAQNSGGGAGGGGGTGIIRSYAAAFTSGVSSPQ